MIPPIPAIGEGAEGLVARIAPMPAPMSDITPPNAVEETAKAGGVSGFGTLLSRAVSGLVADTGNADRLQEMAASGQLPDPTVAIVATEKADLSLRMAVQVRNRLLEGWQEINRMGI